MIVLDTNIISELMKKHPADNVVAWLNAQDVNELFITAITIAEISYGISILPIGNRRSVIEDEFNKAINGSFKHRLLIFDETAAHIYGKIMGKRRASGRPLSILDGQIASITLAHKAVLATRNVSDFSDCELDLVNPF